MLNFRSVLGERVSTSAILDDSYATFSGGDFQGRTVKLPGADFHTWKALIWPFVWKVPDLLGRFKTTPKK